MVTVTLTLYVKSHYQTPTRGFKQPASLNNWNFMYFFIFYDKATSDKLKS